MRPSDADTALHVLLERMRAERRTAMRPQPRDGAIVPVAPSGAQSIAPQNVFARQPQGGCRSSWAMRFVGAGRGPLQIAMASAQGAQTERVRRERELDVALAARRTQGAAFAAWSVRHADAPAAASCPSSQLALRPTRQAPPPPIQPPHPAFVPYAQYAAQLGLPQPHGGGQRVLLLGLPAVPPPGYTPFVQGLQGEAKELARRLLEACRIHPAVSAASWHFLLDASSLELSRWPPARLLATQLDALCAIGGHEALGRARCAIHNLDAFMQEGFGWGRLECMRERVSVTCFKQCLRERAQRAALTARALAARSDKTLAAEEMDGSGAAAALLTSLKLAKSALNLPWPLDHPQLQQFATRPPTREDGGAEDPDLSLVLTLELLALDATLNAFERGSAALGALQAHAGLRGALSKRSRRPRRNTADMAVGAAGMDLKKGKWRTAGRPYVVQTRGFLGSDAWFNEACSVLDLGDFNATVKSLLRAHNGAGGNPALATAWLMREPTRREWNETLRHLVQYRPRVPDGEGGTVSLPDAAASICARPSSHTLKKVKPCVYAAARVHPDYMVEANAHAGARTERITVAAMESQVQAVRPTGTSVAMRYARGALSPSTAALEYGLYAALRAWIAQVGLSGAAESWSGFTAWTMNAAAMDAVSGDAALLKASGKADEPEVSAASAAAADEALMIAVAPLSIDDDDIE